MVTRPVWRGYLKLSLVTCAVDLFNATTASEKIRRQENDDQAQFKKAA
jgi:non-homologous end joining protein Ku